MVTVVMRGTRLASIFFASMLAIAGCGSGGMSDDDPATDADPGATDGGGEPDADLSDYTKLVTGSWTLAPGTERYWCSRKTVTEDIYVNTFRDMSPVGTHHTVVSLKTNPTQPDGEFPCAAAANEQRLLYASGVGTDEFRFPAGIGVRIPAGSQLLLNLHLFNTSDVAMSGTSGALVKTVSAGEITQEAEMIFGGKLPFTIPASPTPFSLSGSCTFDQTATVVNIWPHMHQIGTHLKVTHEGTVLHDMPFDFEEQRNWPIDEPGLVVSAGESIDVECTWVNTTGVPVSFGDSSEQEMCFAGFYRYPATGAPMFCVDLN